jgi:polysaccharide export outer membrane protein
MPHRHVRRLIASLSLVAAPFVATAAQAPATQTAAVSGVGPGDRIMLKVWREPLWSDSLLLVSPDGDIVLPRIGRFHAAGIVPAALRDTIERRLAAFLRDPSVDVVVMRRVAVLGAVRKPDVYYVDPSASLRDVLARAGGLSDDADANRIDLVRSGARSRLGRWDDVAERSAPVQSGDEVYVRRRPWFTRNAVATISSVAVAVSVLLTALK